MSDDVPEADALEQRQDVTPDEEEAMTTTPADADPADALEQSQVVPDDDGERRDHT